MNHYKNNFLIAFFVSTAISCFTARAADVLSNEHLSAKILLANGREIICEILSVDKNEIKIKRKIFGGALANEFYKLDQIKKIDLQKPAILTNNFVLVPGSIRKTKAKIKKVYDKYKPFAKLPGKTWTVELSELRANILEKNKNYSSALTIYNRLAKNKFHPELKNKVLLRRAVCLYELGSISNSLPLFVQAYDIVDSSDLRAEINFYLGKIYAQLGDYKKSLFTLLRNEVFYGTRGDWEVKSLDAALYSYAKLNREKEFIKTCVRITNKFSKTQFSRRAEKLLQQIKNHELISITNNFFF